MSDAIKISVEPEVNFDPAIFATFQNAAVRAASNVVAATNRASKAQQTLGFNIQTTGTIATKTAAQVIAAQAAMTGATTAQTAARVAAIQTQINAINTLTQATQQLGNAAANVPRIQVAGKIAAAPSGMPTNKLVAGSQMNSAFSQGTSNVLGMAREVARGTGLDFDVSNSLQRNLGIGREAINLAVQGQVEDPKGTAQQIETQARQIALQTGGDVQDIIKALRKFHAYTGDLKQGMEQLGNIAASSVAYDTNITEMASLYAVITKYMGKSGTKQGVDKLVRTIATQGREGAVEIADQIKQDPKILVGSSQFGVTKTMLKAFGGDKTAAQAASALGLQQAIMGVSGESANQAGNAVKSFMETLTQGNAQKGFAKHGFDLFTKDENGKKVFKSLEEIISFAAGKAEQDPTLLRELMPNVRGRKVPQAFSRGAKEAYDESLSKGLTQKDAEEAAANVALQQIREAAIKFQEESGRMLDVQTVMTSEAGEVAKLQAQVRERMDQATKTIVDSVVNNLPTIDAGVKLFADGIAAAAEHPKLALVAAFSVPVLQQSVGNALGTALAPALGTIAAALGPFGIGILAVTAAMGLLMALTPEPGEDATPKPGEGAAGAPGNPNSSNGGTEGQGSTESKYVTAQQEALRLQFEQMKEQYGFTPAPGGFTKPDPGVSRDFKTEALEEQIRQLGQDRPIRVVIDSGAAGAPNREQGVIVELSIIISIEQSLVCSAVSIALLISFVISKVFLFSTTLYCIVKV